MAKVVIIGGGWAGCGAAVTAAKAGADVLVLERTDMLLGTGLVGGIMRNNGRFTATEEAIALGAPELFMAVDETARHKNMEFPGHKHATLYDVAKIEPAVRRVLDKLAVHVRFLSRVKDVKMNDRTVEAVVLDSGEEIRGDVFIEATGSAGPMGNCSKYGNGCAMCILRCPTFGGRVSIAAKAGVIEIMGRKADGTVGAMSGSCKLHKESLAKEIVKELNQKGVSVIPIPAKLQKSDSLGMKACQQYALKEFAENIILLDTGHAKLMSPYYQLDKLRQVPGFENARFEDPYSGGIGNSMRYLALPPRSNALKVDGVDNLFCAGEKAGLLVGHTEAIVTGSLAGHNAVRFVKGKELLELPTNLAIGDAIAHVKEQMQTEAGLGKKYTFSGSVYFERMKKLGLYSTDVTAIQKKIEDAGLLNIFGASIQFV
ncbi:FAD-dependent oxidoreductase [Heliobacillus mobilis]|uniref:FAD-dependent oxidoreductase n=1 Tax=Heliobacterium mobile TaxID=28064 RepID=A0A6I3SJ28_HELMO|nr:FAD-dependent oxidoreductase [Heliobacterium mobile]MTV48878.1 FAD-dependent oxidoreductase [Heliobacterium mobile]